MAEKTPIIIVGAPGNMGSRCFDAIRASKDFEVAELNVMGGISPVALTGDKIGKQIIDDTYVRQYRKEKGIYLERPVGHPVILGVLKEKYGNNLMGLNFANADGFNVNNQFLEFEIPFLYGGTGVKPEHESDLVRRIEESKTICGGFVKNFALPILSLMNNTEDYATTNPGVMKDCVSVCIKESHQSTKQDPSGTAIKMSQYFGVMGAGNCPFDSKDIKANRKKYEGIFDMIRDEQTQLTMGVREEHLGGHGWHQYTFKPHSDKGIVAAEEFLRALATDFFTARNPCLRGYEVSGNHWFDMSVSSAGGGLCIETGQDYDGNPVLNHDISGRQPYVDGVMQIGLPMLIKAIRSGEKGKVYFESDLIKAA